MTSVRSFIGSLVLVAVSLWPNGGVFASESSHLYLVMAGVSEYSGGFQPLRDAGKGASEFARTLVAGHAGPVHVMLLVDQQVDTTGFPSRANVVTRSPTTTSVLVAVKEFAERAAPEDLLIFFFMGHGTVVDGDQQILHATESDNDSAYFIPLSEVSRRIAASKASRRIIILDTCRTLTTAGSPVQENQFYRDELLDPRRTATIATVYSSSSGFEAWYNPQRGMGYFTQHLVDNWSCDVDGYVKQEDPLRPDGFLTLNEIFEKTSREVTVETARVFKSVAGQNYAGQQPRFAFEGAAGSARDVLVGQCRCAATSGQACCSTEPRCSPGLECVNSQCVASTSVPQPTRAGDFKRSISFGGKWMISRDYAEQYEFFVSGVYWAQELANRTVEIKNVELKAPGVVTSGEAKKVGFDWGVRIGGADWEALPAGKWKDSMPVLRSKIRNGLGDLTLQVVSFADEPWGRGLIPFQWSANLESGNVIGEPYFESKGSLAASRFVKTSDLGLGIQVYGWTGWWPPMTVEVPAISVVVEGVVR